MGGFNQIFIFLQSLFNILYLRLIIRDWLWQTTIHYVLFIIHNVLCIMYYVICIMYD